MIRAHNLTRHFGTLTAVSRLSLDVPAGSVLALLGPNGAGKTTTVRMLAGLIAPSEGEAMVAGYDIGKEAREVRTNVGLVTDVPGLYEQMTPESYLSFFGKIYGMFPRWRIQRINMLLELFELGEQRQKKLESFSKGMKQKVALARALLHDPSVLFLDEPTSGLDPLAARAVRELILGLKHASRSIVLCTHDLDEAEKLADRVAIMRRGQVVACDTPTSLRARASGETEVRIKLAQHCAQALEILRAQVDVISPSVSGEDKQASPTLLVYRTTQPEVVNPQIVARLSQAGAQLVAVNCETTSLEDIYVSAMREIMQEESVTGEARQPAITRRRG